MKVLVSVKDIATVVDEVELEGAEVADSCLEYDFNEWDEYALEAAVQLSEADDDVEVVTVTVGPERAEETIRMALAKGADRALRIWEPDLADDLLDTRVRAALLAAVVEDEQPDLVLTGVQSGDLAFGTTGVALAEAVDYAWAAVVNDLDLEPGADVARVHRELEGGLEELAEVELPAVLTIQSGINEPRYASLRGIRQAQSKPLDVLDLADLGLDAADATGRLAISDVAEPETGGEARLWSGGPEETAGKLAEFLRESGVVEG